jgi:NADPH-dependent 2,4-dienoyl-CoA reductase/sulfur reductase-like enzyme
MEGNLGKGRVAVIGAQAADMSAASAAKRVNPALDVVVFEKSPFISYSTCSIPYYVSNDIKDHRDLVEMTPEVAQTERGIVVRTGQEAVAIDVEAKVLSVEEAVSGTRQPVPFDRLVIATGAAPIRPHLPGIDLQNIFTIRTLEDGLSVRQFIDSRGPDPVDESSGERPGSGKGGRQKVARLDTVIVGGGYIGMEMCEALRKRGANVAVVERMDRVLGAMDSPITNVVEEKLAQQGVKLYKGTTVEGFEGLEGRVSKVVTDKGKLDAHMVILAIGVLPLSQIAVSAGIGLGAQQAISVDDHMRTNAPDIYAAGDCADAILLVTGKKAYIPLGTTANKQGRVAGENIGGRESVFDGIAGTAQTKVFDLEVARTGLSSLEAAREGLDCFVSTIRGRSRARAYPLGKKIFVTYVVERGSGRLLGAQMVGEEGVAHRIDTLAACLYGRMTIEDVSRLDLGYAPPFATVWDPILIAANVALKELREKA